MLLDNLPTIWVVAIVLFSIVLVSNHANATPVNKSKAEWHQLYVQAGCMEKTFLQREICKTKVFQKTNWQSGKEQITGFFNKLDLSND